MVSFFDYLRELQLTSLEVIEKNSYRSSYQSDYKNSMMSKVNFYLNYINLQVYKFNFEVDFAHHTGSIIEGLYNKDFMKSLLFNLLR